MYEGGGGGGGENKRGKREKEGGKPCGWIINMNNSINISLEKVYTFFFCNINVLFKVFFCLFRHKLGRN